MAITPGEPSTVEGEKPNGGDLDRSLVHGIAWTGVFKWAGQIITWASTIVVARLLRPEDYGLVGMATLYLGFVSTLNSAGFGWAVVVIRTLSARQIAQINSVALALGLASFLASFAVARPLARFFAAPELTPVVIALSASVIFTAIRTIPQALLEKELRFRLLALIDVSQSLLRVPILIGFALAGYGYWALVLGNVLGDVIWTALVLSRRRHAFAIPRFAEVAHAMHFSGHMLVSSLSWYVFANADFAVAGRVLGKEALGAYSFAWTLASLPVEKVTSMIRRVTPAFFSRVQSDPAELRRYLLGLTEGIAIITFPAAIGLAAIADDLVPLALGSQWLGAVAPLQILACYAAFRSIRNLIPQIIMVTGRTRFGMWNAVASAIILPVAFWIGASWGTVGIAATWCLVHPLVSFPIYWVSFHEIGLTWRAYARSLWSAASSTALMLAAIFALRAFGGDAWSPLVRISAEIATGAAIYSAAIALFHRARLARFLRIVKPGAPRVSAV